MHCLMDLLPTASSMGVAANTSAASRVYVHNYIGNQTGMRSTPALHCRQMRTRWWLPALSTSQMCQQMPLHLWRLYTIDERSITSAQCGA